MKPKIIIRDIASFIGITYQGIHMSLKSRDIKHYVLNNKTAYLTHLEARQLLGIKIKPKVISFELVKGGVGKTSICFNFAVRASLYGLRCLVIDLDQQANLTRSFGVDDKKSHIMIDIIKNNLSLKDNLINVCDGIDLFPSGFKNAMLNTTLLINNLELDKVFKEQIEPLKNNYDLILIDCPPDLGAAVSAAALASDLIIAPVEPDKFSMSGLELTINEINNISTHYNKNIPVKIVVNKFNGKTNLSHQTLASLYTNDNTKDLVLKTFITDSQELPNSFNNGVSIFENLKKTTSKLDFDLLVRELIELLKVE